MHLPDEMAFSPGDFSGKVRLFPLPNLVMFPHVLQPLHVFEPRYRELVEESLDGDRLIAMAVLAPGWESNYEGRPDLHPVACLGRIASHQRLEDGRFNLLLAGLKRVELVRELPAEKLFREADVDVLDDSYPASAAAKRPTLQRRLADAFRRKLSDANQLQKQLDELLSGEISLGMLTDVLAFTLKLKLEVKLALLRETEVDRRAEMLLSAIEAVASGENPAGKFPPDFSLN